MTKFGNNPLSGFRGEDFKKKVNDGRHVMIKAHVAFYANDLKNRFLTELSAFDMFNLPK